jgi:2'-5' RNA ligase
VSSFAYADPSSWQDWQREYRYGALYVFPPVGVIEAIDALRTRHDPTSASYCQAHISLSEPLPAPVTAAAIEELRAALARIEPFEVTHGPLRSFPPYPGVVYDIEPAAEFYALRAAVHATSIFAGSSLTRQGTGPHMTIAEFITLDRTDELMRELQGNVPTGRFLCDRVEYAVPNERFFFERVLALPLGSGTHTSTDRERRSP